MTNLSASRMAAFESTAGVETDPSVLHAPDIDCITEPVMSIVICTTGNHSNLASAIGSVLSQRMAALELIVVDNRPMTGHALDVVSEFHSDPRVRYIVEPIAGLSVARNTGIRHALGKVIAFTDDDCVVDPEWSSRIFRLLQRYPTIACITGRTVAMGESTTWERLFEEFGTFDRGQDRVLWRHSGGIVLDDKEGARLPEIAGTHSAIYPYTGVFGSGNNMAFRAAAFSEHGLFDEALGAGAPAGGGEDLDMFIRLILAGESLVFEPTAVVRHQHRGSADALAAQISNYGSGLSAMITKQLVHDSGSWHRILRRALPGVVHLVRPSSVKNARKGPGYPLALTVAEWRGIVMGPWLYLRGRRAVRRRSRRVAEAVRPLPPVGG